MGIVGKHLAAKQLKKGVSMAYVTKSGNQDSLLIWAQKRKREA